MVLLETSVSRTELGVLQLETRWELQTSFFGPLPPEALETLDLAFLGPVVG